MSSHNQPHDVVGANNWLKRWAQGRKGKDDMNQEFDLAGRPENGGNLGRAIPQTHLLVSKIRRDIPPDTQGLHITTRSTWRPFGSERLDMSSSTCLTAEGLSTGFPVGLHRHHG